MPVAGPSPEILTDEEKKHVEDLILLGVDEYIAFLKVLVGLYPDPNPKSVSLNKEEVEEKDENNDSKNIE